MIKQRERENLSYGISFLFFFLLFILQLGQIELTITYLVLLSSTAINHIQSICKNKPNTAVVYWYFTFRDPASQIVDHCLRSLVTNLCSKRADTPKALQEAYEQCNNGQLSPSTKSMMAMLPLMVLTTYTSSSMRLTNVPNLVSNKNANEII